MTKPLIYCDVDGVLADLLPHWIEWYNERADKKLAKLEDFKTYDLASHVDDPKELLACLKADKFYRFIPPTKNAATSVRTLKKLGSLTIMSYIPPSDKQATAEKDRTEWLGQHFGIKNWKFMEPCKRHLVDCDYMIEDSPSALIPWCKNNPKGIGILIDQVYNRPENNPDFDWSLPNFARVGDIERAGVLIYHIEWLRWEYNEKVSLAELLHPYEVLERSNSSLDKLVKYLPPTPTSLQEETLKGEHTVIKESKSSSAVEESKTGGKKHVGGKDRLELVPAEWSRWIESFYEGDKQVDASIVEMHLHTWNSSGDIFELIAALRCISRGIDSNELLDQVRKVMQYGAYDKVPAYGPLNWTKGCSDMGLWAAAVRHLTKWYNDEEFDKDSGLSHQAHAACNIMMMISMISHGIGVRDRAKYNLQTSVARVGVDDE